jgi:hypothetical protein
MIRMDRPDLSATELVLCTAVNVGANQTTVVRGQESTSGVAFAINSTGGNDLTAQMLTDAFVRLDTALSQTLTGPLVIPPAIGVAAAATSYGTVPVKIAEVLLAAPAASITFSSLPTGFRHLLAEWYARGDAVTTSRIINLTFNNIVTGTYNWQLISGTGASAVATEGLSQTAIIVGDVPAASATAAYFGSGEAKVMYYGSAVGNKVVVARSNLFTANSTGTGFSKAFTGMWQTTAAPVTRMDFTIITGSFVVGSLFTLCGEP